MSVFQGKLSEFGQIAVDNFTAETHKCTAFFLSHCHTDHMKGLLSKEFLDVLKKSNNKIFLFCSETTKNLLCHDKQCKDLCEYTKAIPVSQPTMITIFNENMQSSFELTITLISAGHCVGSVMFLFEGQESSVLYTGDFRIAKGDIRKVKWLKTQHGVKRIKELYIDTTFCTPTIPQLPTREESKNEMVRLIKSWLKSSDNHFVFICCAARYGYEFLFKEIAREFKTKIHVDEEKYSLYSRLPGITEFVTSDDKSTKIHSCSWKIQDCSHSSLPCDVSFSMPIKILKIKPSTLWIFQHKQNHQLSSYDEKSDLHRVLYSMHSSFEEIADVVSYLQPDYVFPTVVPADANDILDAFTRLGGFLTSQATRLSMKINSESTSTLSSKRAKMFCNEFSKLEAASDLISMESSSVTKCRKATNKTKLEPSFEAENFDLQGDKTNLIANDFLRKKSKQKDSGHVVDCNITRANSGRDDDNFDIPVSPGVKEPSHVTLANFYREMHKDNKHS